MKKKPAGEIDGQSGKYTYVSFFFGGGAGILCGGVGTGILLKLWRESPLAGFFGDAGLFFSLFIFILH